MLVLSDLIVKFGGTYFMSNIEESLLGDVGFNLED